MERAAGKMHRPVVVIKYNIRLRSFFHVFLVLKA